MNTKKYIPTWAENATHYHCGPPSDTTEYRGYTITAIYDESPMNPFDDWDTEPPLYVAGTDKIKNEYGLDLSIPELTRDQIRKNLPAILEYLEYPTLWAAIFEEYPIRYRDDIPTMINEMLSEYADGLYETDRMEMVAKLYAWQGIESLVTSRAGSSQSDYVEILIVATPEWIQKVGAATETIQQQLKNAADLYGYWAFGDCYGYTVTDPEGEFIDSCYGFYGDHDKSGLLDAATDTVDFDIQHQKQKRFDTIKTMIRNRVPLHYRMEAQQ